MRAWLNLRFTVPERRAAFRAGLEKLGISVFDGFPDFPNEKDILVTWNRIGDADRIASIFENRGGKVLVAENAAWGNDFAGQRWYTITRNYHNVSGTFDVGSDARWRHLSINLRPWRAELGETVILPQRGIGPPRTRMPSDWTQKVRKRGRVRLHPGSREDIPLESDLLAASKVITWGSGAAIKALIWGIRVESHLPNWIGEQDNTDAGRLAMFERLAWAQWSLDEIARGLPFKRLLGL